MEYTDVLIIGGCAAGMSAAAAARRESKKISITVLEKGKFISYGSCAIPHYIEGKIPDWKLLVHHTPEEFIKERNVNVIINAEAIGIDVSKKTVTYFYDNKQNKIKYGKLLISTGARPFDPFNISRKYENTFVCRNVEDAIQIKNFVDKSKGKKVAIFGSGYVGLELACAFKERGLDVTVFEKLGRILIGYLPDISAEVQGYLTEKGIKINVGESVQDFIADGNIINKVKTDKNEYNFDLILLSIGARPSTDFLKKSGIAFGKFGEIKIDRSMKTNIQDIYSAGDCAGTYNAFTGEYIYFPLAQTANKQGKIAGMNMAGDKELTLNGVVKTQGISLFDLELASTGLSIDEAKSLGFDVGIETINSFTRAYRDLGGKKIKISIFYDKKAGLILGAQMIGGEGTALRANMFALAIYAKMNVQDFWNIDTVYVPSVAPVYDATLIAARAAFNNFEKSN